MPEESRKAIAAAFAANLGIAIAKFAGFAVTGAASLLAEAIHSVADTGNQALLFLGGRRARRRPTAEHPFGFGQERYFWAFIVALMLFSLGGLFAVVEGIDKLVHPHALESFPIALAVLGVAIVLEALSFRTAMKQAAEISGNSRWDALGSIGIGILLGVIAIVLATEMKSLLIGESASGNLEDAISAAMTDGKEVLRVIHLRTMHLGPDELLVAAKVEIDAPSMADLARAIDAAEARVRAAVPIARVIYVEPDVYRSDAVMDR